MPEGKRGHAALSLPRDQADDEAVPESTGKVVMSQSRFTHPDRSSLGNTGSTDRVIIEDHHKALPGDVDQMKHGCQVLGISTDHAFCTTYARMPDGFNE